MNYLTLSLPRGLEDRFWHVYKKPLLACDALFAIVSIAMLVFVDLKSFSLSIRGSKVYHNHNSHYYMTFIAIQALQTMFILASPESYWRWRVCINMGIQAYIAHISVASIASITSNPAFMRPSCDWLGGTDGVVTSDAAIFSALFMPTGAVSALKNVLQHQVPFRFVLPLQMYVAWRLICAGWAPVAKLITHHPKLRADALWLCETMHEGISIAKGWGGMLHTHHQKACASSYAPSRTVLATQIMFIFIVPLWVLYMVEAAAKSTFLAKQQRQDTQEAQGSNHRATLRPARSYSMVYVVLRLLVAIMVCDFMVDVLCWLKALPGME
jgi:hypothetical protein